MTLSPQTAQALLEAAKEMANAASAHVPSAVAIQHASIEWKRTYEAYHRLRSSIASAEREMKETK